MAVSELLERLGERGEAWLDTDLTYDGLTPVRVHVVKREGRYVFSDDGAAVATAGVDPEDVDLAGPIVQGPYSANVSRMGVVSLPGFRRSSPEWLDRLPDLVAGASRDLYSALLELDD
jgi:hypothetical protein